MFRKSEKRVLYFGIPLRFGQRFLPGKITGGNTGQYDLRSRSFFRKDIQYFLERKARFGQGLSV